MPSQPSSSASRAASSSSCSIAGLKTGVPLCFIDIDLQQWAPWPRPRAHDECLLGRRCHTHPLPHVLSSPLKVGGRHSKNLKFSARQPVMPHKLPDIFLAFGGLLDAGECEHAIGTCRGSQVRKRRK